MNILARSPFIIDVSELGQAGSKIEIFLWNGSGSAPLFPTYTLSKLAPSPTDTANYYNIAPYLREFIDNTVNPNVYNTIGPTDYDSYVNVRVKRYSFNGSSYNYLDLQKFFGWNGFGFYEDGGNPDMGDYFLDQKTYYYYYEPFADLTTEIYKRAGFITMLAPAGGSIEYVNLLTGSIISAGFGSGAFQDIYRVHPVNYADGNRVNIYDNLGNGLAKWTFRPITECRYEVQTVDFINRYGAWQREFFFKASFDQLTVNNKSYQLMQTKNLNYNTAEGNFKDFNTNGRQTIKLNTGSVPEDFKDNLTEMSLSERILLNGFPVTMKTNGFERIKSVNKKDINYTVEFEMAYETINNIV